MKKSMKKFLILFAVYCFLVFTPFMFEALNQIEPLFLAMPFTVWTVHVLIAAGCTLVYWGSKSAWDSFDDYQEEDESK